MQGYELEALRVLRDEGVNMKNVKHHLEIERVQYKLDGKHRNYLPDFQYKNTIIEVKSEHTAGVRDATNNYERFRMLKAKARACILKGFGFRLMLFVGDKRKGTLKLVPLPDSWITMRAKSIDKLIWSL